MEFVDFSNHQPQRSNSDENMSPVYYENVVRQLSFNPAILVLTLAVYVLLLFLGILSNVRVVSIIRRRFSGGAFIFDVRLIDLDVFSLCCSNLLSILCFMFVIFDLAYGQWMLPSKILCRFYLSAEGFTRSISGMILLHSALLCAYFVTRIQAMTSNASTSGLFEKIGLHYFYIVVLCPSLALILSIVLFQHADVQYSVIEIPVFGFENETESVTIAKCVLRLSDRMSTSLTIYGSVCGYLAPLTAFVFASLMCKCRCKRVSDQLIRRYVFLITNYATLFFLCHTPAWAMSVYDYLITLSVTPISEDRQRTTAFVSYFAHTLSYFTSVGYPLLYLRNMSINRVSSDISGESLALGRDETVMSLTSGQQFLGRDVSRDVLLLANRRPIRSRTLSNLQISNVDAVVNVVNERHSSYQTLRREREEEDQF